MTPSAESEAIRFASQNRNAWRQSLRRSRRTPWRTRGAIQFLRELRDNGSRWHRIVPDSLHFPAGLFDGFAQQCLFSGSAGPAPSYYTIGDHEVHYRGFLAGVTGKERSHATYGFAERRSIDPAPFTHEKSAAKKAGAVQRRETRVRFSMVPLSARMSARDEARVTSRSRRGRTGLSHFGRPRELNPYCHGQRCLMRDGQDLD